MIDVSQWRASIGLWNYCQAASSRPANGCHSQSFKAAVDSKSGSTTSGKKTSNLPAALSFIFSLQLSLLRYMNLKFPPTGIITVTVMIHCLQSLVLFIATIGSSSDLIYYLVLFLLLLLSGDVELNPGPMIDDQPSCPFFARYLEPLVDWEPFALCLPGGMTQLDADIIKTKGSSYLRMEALHKRWLQVNATASWRDVINALKQCEENELARTIEDKVTDPTAGRSTNDDMEVSTSNANPGPAVTGNPKDILRTHSAELTSAISGDLLRVTNELHAARLIPKLSRQEMLVIGIDSYTKSTKLVNVIEQQLESSLNPEQYLIDICHVLVNQQHCTLTDIATSILHQLDKDIPHSSMLSTSQAMENRSSNEQEIWFQTKDDEINTQKSLSKIENNFTSLMVRVNETFIKCVAEKPDLLHKIKLWLKNSDYLTDHISIGTKIPDTKTIEEIFDSIHPIYDCIDCDLIMDMCKALIPEEQDIANELGAHHEDAEKFYSSTTIEQLKKNLENLYQPYLANGITKMPKMIIKLQNRWSGIKMKGLKRLIGKMLPLDSKQSILQYIEIIPGSVTVHYYALDITADSLIEYTGGKLRFMRLIGIFSLYINDHPVLQEDENMNFTFELALLEAVTAGNIEAVEFLLQLETVNIDHTNEEGKTALMLACKRGHEDIVHTLLSAGANVNIQDNHGQTALMMASTNTLKKSVATYTKPDFMLLNQWLEPLVDWQSFGLLLPGITQWNIITIQQLNAKHQKLALFTKWLNTDPTATWRDVLNALTKREEINLLQTINDQLQVHQCTRGREVDESNKSSIQSSESEKEESKKKMTKAMQMEIDHLRSIKSERDDLLEENAKLKATIDTLESEKEESKKKMTKAVQTEIDHLRSSLQSKTGVEKTLIEREKEIEQLQEKISLMNIQQLKETSITLRKDQSTQSIDPPKGPVYVAIRDWEARESDELSIKKGEKLEIKKERTEGWWVARSLDTDQEGLVPINYIIKDEESELSTLESLELFHYAITENVDIPKIKEIKTRSNVERASLLLSLIKQDSVLLDQLRKKEHEKPKAIRWYDDGVELTSPSLIQCQEVVSLLTSKHTFIKIIKSSPEVVSDLLPVLLQNEKVESLIIQDTQLTQDCISSLCNLLANNKSLIELVLNNCSIDDKAVADITNVLQTHNNTLKKLYFFDNSHITSVSAQSLSELIIKNSTLTELQISHTSISSDGILLILQSLTINKNIKKLYLNMKHKDTCTEYHDYNIIKDRVKFYK